MFSMKGGGELWGTDKAKFKAYPIIDMNLFKINNKIQFLDIVIVPRARFSPFVTVLNVLFLLPLHRGSPLWHLPPPFSFK